MPTSEQIKALWRNVRERSAEGERLRRRIRAIGAVLGAVSGLLVIIGLGLLVLAFFIGMLVAAALMAFVATWPRIRPKVAHGIRGLRSQGRTTRGFVAPLVGQAYRSSRATVAVARTRGTALAGTALESGSRVGRELIDSTRTAATKRSDPKAEALRLNTAGTQHRRSGEYDEAVECHRRALEILRGLDDRRAIALTQSNLALALSHSGDDDWAIGLFEESAAILRELGDSEHEAQIMANLGLAHRRHGRREEGDNVLQLALTKLSPESRAYHTIEAQLRRAS